MTNGFLLPRPGMQSDGTLIFTMSLPCMLGAGVLGLPYAMAELGWYVPCSKFLLHPSLVCFAA